MTNRNSFYALECSKAVSEYRAQAVKYCYYPELRLCYIHLALKNRRQQREYALKAQLEQAK